MDNEDNKNSGALLSQNLLKTVNGCQVVQMASPTEIIHRTIKPYSQLFDSVIYTISNL